MQRLGLGQPPLNLGEVGVVAVFEQHLRHSHQAEEALLGNGASFLGPGQQVRIGGQHHEAEVFAEVEEQLVASPSFPAVDGLPFDQFAEVASGGRMEVQIDLARFGVRSHFFHEAVVSYPSPVRNLLVGGGVEDGPFAGGDEILQRIALGCGRCQRFVKSVAEHQALGTQELQIRSPFFHQAEVAERPHLGIAVQEEHGVFWQERQQMFGVALGDHTGGAIVRGPAGGDVPRHQGRANHRDGRGRKANVAHGAWQTLRQSLRQSGAAKR